MSKAKELARAIREFPKSSYVWVVHDELGDLIDAVLSEPDQSTRIAELEAEVERLKDPYSIFTEWQKDQLRKLEEIKQQSATDFDEGEG